eukprot:scaffold32817_cov31-Tisochrysis_lutea.AAC.1
MLARHVAPPLLGNASPRIFLEACVTRHPREHVQQVRGQPPFDCRRGVTLVVRGKSARPADIGHGKYIGGVGCRNDSVLVVACLEQRGALRVGRDAQILPNSRGGGLRNKSEMEELDGEMETVCVGIPSCGVCSASMCAEFGRPRT